MFVYGVRLGRLAISCRSDSSVVLFLDGLLKLVELLSVLSVDVNLFGNTDFLECDTTVLTFKITRHFQTHA